MRRTLYILAAVAALAALLLGTSVRQELGWVDRVSGSRKSQTAWRFGWSSSPVVTESPLAARYRQLGLRWQPDWRNVHGTYHDAFGRSVGHAHGSAPAIYHLAMDPALQAAFLAGSSDGEVRAFFRVMSDGTEAEQEAAVEAAYEKALGDDANARADG